MDGWIETFIQSIHILYHSIDFKKVPGLPSYNEIFELCVAINEGNIIGVEN